jgi:hypothetical protein
MKVKYEYIIVIAQENPSIDSTQFTIHTGIFLKIHVHIMYMVRK